MWAEAKSTVALIKGDTMEKSKMREHLGNWEDRRCPCGWSLQLSEAHARVIRIDDSSDQLMPCGGLLFLAFIYFSGTHIVTNNNLAITQHKLSMKHTWFPNWLKSWPVFSQSRTCCHLSAPLIRQIINHCWGWRATTSVQMEQRWRHRCPRGSRSLKTG